MVQLQRVGPSARGSGTRGRTRFARARRRDSMCAEPKPRTAMTTETIIVERHGRVGIVRLNRPQALNALNATLRNELLGAVEALDADAEVGCILDRKSTRLNSSHSQISYAVFCLKKKTRELITNA